MMGFGFFLLMLCLGRIAIAADPKCALSKREETIWGFTGCAGIACMVLSLAIWLFRAMP